MAHRRDSRPRSVISPLLKSAQDPRATTKSPPKLPPQKAHTRVLLQQKNLEAIRKTRKEPNKHTHTRGSTTGVVNNGARLGGELAPPEGY